MGDWEIENEDKELIAVACVSPKMYSEIYLKSDGTVIEIIKSKGFTNKYLVSKDKIINEWSSLDHFVSTVNYELSKESNPDNYIGHNCFTNYVRLLLHEDVDITQESIVLRRKMTELSITEKSVTKTSRDTTNKRVFSSINTSKPRSR